MGIFNRKVTLAAPDQTTDGEPLDGTVILDPEVVTALAELLDLDPATFTGPELLEAVTLLATPTEDEQTTKATLTAADATALKAEAAEGAKAIAELRRRDADELVAAAIEEGRILAAHRQTWVADAVADYNGTKLTLSGLPAGRVPVSEKGRGGSDEQRERMAGWVR